MDHKNVIDYLVPACYLNVLIFLFPLFLFLYCLQYKKELTKKSLNTFAVLLNKSFISDAMVIIF